MTQQPQPTKRDRHPDAQRADETMTRARRLQLLRAIEDHAARYAVLGPAAPARYIAETTGATREEWQLIAEYIDEHPEVLALPVRTYEEVRRDNRAAAEQLAREAHERYQDGYHMTALDLIDQAAAHDPQLYPWDAIRAHIHHHGEYSDLAQGVEDACDGIDIATASLTALYELNPNLRETYRTVDRALRAATDALINLRTVLPGAPDANHETAA